MKRAPAPLPPVPPREHPETAGDIVEYLFRVAFFAAAPFGIVVLASLVPMTAAIANIVLALLAFFFGEVLRKHAERRGWLGRILRRQLAFEAYYRERAPQPFIYYVFYPLLFPYWLTVREARRELWLFKGYTFLTFGVALVSGVHRYLVDYQPDIGFRTFVVSFAIGLGIEALAVIMFLMPITTTVVALHKKAQHGRLVLLLVTALVSAGYAVTVLALRHRTFPSLETRQRVAERSKAQRKKAEATMDTALRSAWQARRLHGLERDSDGTVDGAPLDVAREKLATFYRPDEASAFELWATARADRSPLMVLYAEGPRHGRPVFRAMRPDGTIVARGRDLPKSALAVMRTVGDL
ncbi:MAG: hypothetical protein JWP97_5684 [Labilithrix sp.]|nr:hypothetical protein [Labilithrix sp.]